MSLIYINPYALASTGAAPPVAGAVLWVDASTLTTGTGISAATTSVANLGSQGGSFNIGVYDVVANGISTQNALRFNGAAGRYLKSTNAYTNTGTTLTMFTVLQRIATGPVYSGYVSSIFPGTLDYGDVRNFVYTTSDPSSHIRVERNFTALGTREHPSNGDTFIGTVKFDGTNLTHYQKTTAASTSATSASSGTFGCTSTSLGARQAQSGGDINLYSNVFIGEVLIYNSALNDTDRLAVISYLSTKWGV
jgi:hypothetical protein